VLFEANGSLLNVYSEHNEPRKMFPTVVKAHIMIVSLCLFVGILSYAAFGDLTKDIILYNLPTERWYSVLIQTLYMTCIMGSFVINTPVVFNMIEKDDEMMKSNFTYVTRRVLVVTFIWVLSVLLPDINVVLSLFAGSICGTLLFILPVFFYR